MAFTVVQLLYWLSLSTWFGGLVFIAVAATVVFRTIAESNPILPDVLSVNLDNQHATLLSSTVMMAVLRRFLSVELGAAAAVLVAMVVQPFVVQMSGADVMPAVVRAGLFLTAVGVLGYDRQIIWPRLAAARGEYVDHADEPDVANPAKDRFDAGQRTSMTLLMVRIGLLVGVVLLSASIRPQTVSMAIPTGR